ncbi:hypothetical protein GCM10009802_67060 [Streptomyces synnematoformans]|uniref:Uncharacterized protein n=1 Tax=Streptomyces synnematoformans TaxID=415721 RepID=A0ABN2ADL6_9ACTN
MQVLRHTSVPPVATVRSPLVIDGIRTRPLRAIRQRMKPVSTSVVLSFSVIRNREAGSSGLPVCGRFSRAGGTAAPVVCAVHLTVPSGRNPVGHDCTGTAPPVVVVRSNSVPRGRALRGHGTPRVVPTRALGSLPSRQLNDAPAAAA